MEYVYAVGLHKRMVTKEEILELYDEKYLEKVLKIKDELFKKS